MKTDLVPERIYRRNRRLLVTAAVLIAGANALLVLLLTGIL